MTTKKSILCELAFWKYFSIQNPLLFPQKYFGKSESIKIWINLFSFLERSKIVWNCSWTQFYEAVKDDDNLKLLWKKATNKQCEIDCKPQDFQDMDTLFANNPTSTFISEKDLSIKASEYGIININSKNYTQLCFLFIDNGIAISKGQDWNWDFIKYIISKANNSMIITDNYIFDKCRNNLYKLLELILPHSLAIPYHITIFYMHGRQSESDIQSLKTFLSRIRPNLIIELETIRTNKDSSNRFHADFHDRTIITNNIWIGSGAGFDLLTRDHCHFKANKSTTLSIIFPFFSSDSIKWGDEAYHNLISDAKTCICNRNLSSNNRLLV